MSLFLERLMAAACRNPASTAIVQDTRKTSYGELLETICGVESWLRQRSLASGTTVGLQGANSAAMVAALLGCVSRGMRVLLLDASLKPGEVRDQAEQAGAAAILTVGQSAPFEARVPVLALPDVDVLRSLAASGSAETRHGAEETGAFLLLSSGTSGFPKIVVRTSAQAEAAVRIFAAGLPLNAEDRVLGVLPFCHSFGLLYMLLTTLHSGAGLYLQSFSPRATAQAIMADEITVMPATPFMFRLLSQTHFAATPDFSAVRMAISAGSALPPSVARQFRGTFGVDIIQSYGTTESGPIAFGRLGEECGELARVGRLYPGVRITFSERDPLKTDGVSGLPVTVESPAAAEGYMGNPGMTDSVFAQRRVRTGDLGYLAADGTLVILGRERPLLNVAGKKVAPAEVEACLRSHSRVHDVLVMGEATEDGAQKIVALVVPSGAVTAMELREHVTQRLAHHKAPREIRFVENLSSGPMGKTTLGGHV